MRNLLLLPAMLLSYTMCFAQLYVTPNTTTSSDSYIFVEDQVLFVEQDINLVENTNDPDTQASIYLRDESQLIQGTTNSNNSGTGYISVMQNSRSDSYDYNFWSSPVGRVVGTPAAGNIPFGILAINDSITDTRSQTTNISNGYNGWDTANNLTISRRWLYKKPGASWIPIYTNNNVQAGLGFTMKGTNVTVHANPDEDPNNQVYDFRGRPHNGAITVATTVGSATITGNPYASALDLNRFFYDIDENGVSTNNNTEIFSIRFWDEDRSINSHYYVDNKGGYGTWTPGGADPTGTNPGFYVRPTFLNYDNGGNSTGSTGVMGVYTERRFSPIGQGFQVLAQATNAGAGDASVNSLLIDNKHRRYIREGASNNSQFRNSQNNNTGVVTSGNETVNSNQTPMLRIYTTFGESHIRDMILAFDDAATDGYDWGWDGPHPMDGSLAEAYMPVGPDNNQMPMVIQAVPFTPEKMVPISFNLDEEFKFSVKAVEEVNLPFSAAYLVDTQNDSYKKITGGEEAVQTLPAGEYNNRFFIVFKSLSTIAADDPASVTKEQMAQSVEFFQNNPLTRLEISNPEGYDIRSANIYDMTGKLVLNEENVGKVDRYSFHTGNLSDGVYLVKLTTTDNVTIDYKISVFNKN